VKFGGEVPVGDVSKVGQHHPGGPEKEKRSAIKHDKTSLQDNARLKRIIKFDIALREERSFAVF
jgi:hypothetical protein